MTDVERPSFLPLGDRRSVLDRAHQGDVVGALGRLSSADMVGARRLAPLLAVLGPGVVVMVADNDAGGIGTYTEMGHAHGLLVAGLLAPLALCLFVNQEMAARLGAVTGAGHARLISDRFGRRWGALALGDLVVLNLLLLVTELIGVALGLGYLGVDRRLSVPLAAGALILLGGRGGFRRWERAVLVMVAASLAAVPVLALVVHHPAVAAPVRHAGGPGTVELVLACAGTTVAPWQLFFHQSNVVDKRIVPRLLRLERVDTAIGVTAFLVGALAMVAVGAVVGGGPLASAGAVAHELGASSGRLAGTLFALLLVNGSLLGAAAVSLSTAYAVGDVLGTRHSLHRPWREARTFHGTRAALVALAAAAVLVPGTPLGVVTTGVQVVAAVLLPSALVFLLLLANDRAVLGPWTNARWLNVVATASVGALLVLSALLVTSGLGSHVTDRPAVAAAALVAGTLAGGLLGARLTAAGGPVPDDGPAWTTPRLEQLAPAPPSVARRTGLAVLRAYVIVAALAVGWRLVSDIVGR